jgi:hypothetical protein
MSELLSDRARALAAEAADKRQRTKAPMGGYGATDSASRSELLGQLETAYGLVAELAERVEALEGR